MLQSGQIRFLSIECVHRSAKWLIQWKESVVKGRERLTNIPKIKNDEKMFWNRSSGNSKIIQPSNVKL